jgi:hypothetical protein
MPLGKDRTSQYDVGVGGGGFAPSDTGGRSSDFARALALRLNQYKEMGRDAYKKLLKKQLKKPREKTRDIMPWRIARRLDPSVREYIDKGGDIRDFYEPRF